MTVSPFGNNFEQHSKQGYTLSVVGRIDAVVGIFLGVVMVFVVVVSVVVVEEAGVVEVVVGIGDVDVVVGVRVVLLGVVMFGVDEVDVIVVEVLRVVDLVCDCSGFRLRIFISDFRFFSFLQIAIETFLTAVLTKPPATAFLFRTRGGIF